MDFFCHADHCIFTSTDKGLDGLYLLLRNLSLFSYHARADLFYLRRARDVRVVRACVRA
jgi:hypothetical protein